MLLANEYTKFEKKLCETCSVTLLRYILARSRNHSCQRNATVPSHFIIVGVSVTVDHIKLYSVAMVVQQCVLFAPLSSHKTLRTAVNNSKY
jgi:hypothetical protein